MTLDFDRDMPLTEEDIRVLRELRRKPTSPEAYEALLNSVGHLSFEELVKRRRPRGEPFEL